MIIEKTGDILSTTNTTNIIAHQVNCQGAFGAGLAKQIRNKYPNTRSEYMRYCSVHCADLLGRCQIVTVEPMSDGSLRFIANLFGQYNYGRESDRCYTNYAALRQTLTYLRDYAKFCGYSVSIPYGLGCGLAGGDWSKVYSFIREIFKESAVNCEIWRKI